jgi:ABC-type nitrate/sulfonate/bicarbonate transport system substrate-binding protein
VTTRRSMLAVLASGAVLAAAGCGKSNSDGGSEATELRYQGSVGTVTLPELAADLGYLGNLKLKWIGNTISGPQDIQSAATGQTDFGGAFNGAIIKLAVAGAPITSVISYYGSDAQTFTGYYVLDGGPISSARDLIGKKVGMNTLGAHAEAILKTYLKRGGLSDDEVKQVELVALPPVNTEQSLRQKQIDVAALSGQLRDKALDHGGIHKLFSDYDLLGAFDAGSYVFRKDFLKKNPDTVKTFVTAIGKAIEWSRSQPRDTVIARFSDILTKRARNEDDSQLKYWKSYGVAGKAGLITDQDFTVWIDWLAQNGELKDKNIKPADVYTNQYNGYKDGGSVS